MKNRPEDTIVFREHALPIRAGDIRELLNINCTLHGVDPAAEFRAIAVADNMSIQPGCLFIPYAESDEVAAQTVKKGAAAVMTDHLIPGTPCIVVDDLTKAVYALCERFSSVMDIPAVVVAGSTGKTTTKRLLKCVLQQEKRVFCKSGNYNTMQALCCAYQEVRAGDQIIVQEVDEKRILNTVYCSRLLQPEIAIVTNIADSHLGFYGSKEALTRSFLGITAGLRENGIVILNADDPDSVSAAFDRKTISVGIYNRDADCVASNIIETEKETEFDLRYGEETVHIQLSVLGEHNVYNAMMAYLVGKRSGVRDENILKGLKRYPNTGFRQNIIRLGRTTIYADCYNASSKSLEYALKCFCALPMRRGKRIAVVGDIAEIEGYEDETYRKIASYLDNSNVDVLVTYGKDSQRIWHNLKREMAGKHTGDREELNACLRQLNRERPNAFLLKASRSMKLEESMKAVFPLHYKWMLLRDRLST